MSPDSWRQWSDAKKARLRWSLQARPAQLPPDTDALVWLILAGRYWGKTRTGAEWVADGAYRNPGTDWGVFAPTFAACRDVCVEDRTAGLLAVLGCVETYNRSLGEILLTNGSRIKLVSADEPDRARGWNFSGAWCDELSSWTYPETWETLLPAVRIGDLAPRIVVTTTPKPTPLIRALAARSGDGVYLTKGRSRDNVANVSAALMDELERSWGGTRRGRQELEGELLEDVEGALWQRSWLDRDRVAVAPRPDIIARIVVALDPASGKAEGDEQAIVVAALGLDHRYYVLHSEGVHLSPDAWLRRAAQLFDHFGADRLVYEKNYGDAYLTALIRNVIPNVPAAPVNATQSKRTRAEPISALYEQGRVSHVGRHDVLEDQLCSFSGAPGEASPDRLDALVYAVHELHKGAGGPARWATIARSSDPEMAWDPLSLGA
ncbi:MAG: terminase family protein [Actinomycetota bacterium]|nr:terminase family protein [Actinomycetota bacterium]